MKIAIGADHGGYELKQKLIAHLQKGGHEVLDQGTNSTDAVDYPTYARKVADAVASGQAVRGIMIDGAGIGSSMVANKVPGVRAAMAYDLSSARNSREHNDANLLTLGAGLIGAGLAGQIVDAGLHAHAASEHAGSRGDEHAASDREHRPPPAASLCGRRCVGFFEVAGRRQRRAGLFEHLCAMHRTPPTERDARERVLGPVHEPGSAPPLRLQPPAGLREVSRGAGPPRCVRR